MIGKKSSTITVKYIIFTIVYNILLWRYNIHNNCGYEYKGAIAMLNEEFIKLLLKYQSELWSSTTNEIDTCLKSLIKSTKEIRNHLSNKLYEINTSDDSDDIDCTDILSDIGIVKRQIIQLNELREVIRPSNFNEVEENDKGEDKRTDQREQPVLNYDNTVSVYLLPKAECPKCKYELKTHKIYYKRYINGVATNEVVYWYRCHQCKRLYVTDEQLDKFDNTNTNIIIRTEYYNKISLHDSVYVVGDISHCSAQNHDIKDALASIYVVTVNGEIQQQNVDVIYCMTCGRCTMLKSTYNTLIGIPICTVIDETYEVKGGHPEYWDEKESRLRSFGYNVNCIDDLTTKQRQTILSIVILSNIMTKGEVCSYLDKQISNGEKREGSKKEWTNAVSKWKEDKQFVINLDDEQQREIINIDTLILKFRT